MNRYILKEIFKCKFGIQSDEAINGKEAVDMVKARGYQECCSSYKIIIMDFEMPIMNGLESAKRIRKYTQYINLDHSQFSLPSESTVSIVFVGQVEPNLFIVAYTAYTDEESTCRAAGMDYFCKKLLI